ncbi:MAG: hypothetical protein FJ298_02920 [Planctomycetes bacterium]|nr:hypothetical protein [Planctomycetota bacterium]
MYPHERSLVERLKDEPFALIGVNSDVDVEKLKGALKQENISWRSFWDGPKGTYGPIATSWGVNSWPTIYVLDETGTIRYVSARGPQLDEAVDTLLAELRAKQSGGK